MNVHVYPNVEQLNASAAQLFVQLLQEQPDAVLGLATGGTPVEIYSQIRSAYQRGEISFSRATSFNLDEYVGLPADHPQTYRSYMNANLFDHIDLPARRANIPDGNSANLEEECARYESLIEAAGHIDLQLLGLGHNGHIGFNEPAQELCSRTHTAALEPETREANARYFASIDEVPTQAITMGIGSIMKSRRIVLVVKGADKAEAVKQALLGPITTQCPASLLQIHPNLIVMLDEAAAQQLPIELRQGEE
jgi:glucosamine-6-phosphate deaminase